MWISVDGVEAAGKSTLSGLLADALGGVVSPEFSTTPLATLLRRGVDEDPHIFKRSKLAQTLAFLSEFCERIEEFVLPSSKQGQVVIADRGYLSKYAYQHSVLAMDDNFDAESAHRLIRSIFRHIPKPNLFVLLECPLSTVAERLATRGYEVIAERLAFIDKSQDLLRQLAAEEVKVLRFNTDELPALTICNHIVEHLRLTSTTG